MADQVGQEKISIAKQMKFLRKQGRFDEAIELARTTLDAQPDHPDRLKIECSLGSTLLAAGKLDDALKHMQAVDARFPDDPVVHNTLGQIWLEKARFGQIPIQKVEEFIRENVRKFPGNSTAHNDLGQVLLERGKNDEIPLAQADHHMRETVNRLGHEYSYHILGQVLLERGKRGEISLEDAAHAMRGATKRFPDNEKIQNTLGQILLEQLARGEVQASVVSEHFSNVSQHADVFERGLQVKAHFRLAKVHVQEHRWDDATGELKKAHAAALKLLEVQKDEHVVRFLQMLARYGMGEQAYKMIVDVGCDEGWLPARKKHDFLTLPVKPHNISQLCEAEPEFPDDRIASRVSSSPIFLPETAKPKKGINRTAAFVGAHHAEKGDGWSR